MNAFFETMESRTLMSATISATQKANLQKLAADLSAIHANSSVTVAQLHQLDSDIAVAVKSATSKPSAASVSAFKAELKTTLTSGPITAAEAKALTTDFDAILTSAGISKADAQAVGTDIKGIVTASHVTKAEAQGIWSDLEAIYATFVANH
jgi:hypothetical protein